jgi:hypothetical protein
VKLEEDDNEAGSSKQDIFVGQPQSKCDVGDEVKTFFFGEKNKLYMSPYQ